MIKIGDKVEAFKMAEDSFYKKVRGVVYEIKNGFITIKSTEVIDKLSNNWEQHPTSCITSARVENVKLIGA